MAKALWNGEVIAESNETIVVEGNQYFPRESIIEKFFKKSETSTICLWKGYASYFDVEVDGETNHNAAWYYPDPKPAAEDIKNYIAFWKGIKVQLN